MLQSRNVVLPDRRQIQNVRKAGVEGLIIFKTNNAKMRPNGELNLRPSRFYLNYF